MIFRQLFDPQSSGACLVYPGHDYRGLTATSIGEERRHNPRLAASIGEERAQRFPVDGATE